MDLDAYFAEHPMHGDTETYLRVPDDFKSGFVALVGRPNSGKSTLLNAVMDGKIAITSKTAQTTRNRIQAVFTRSNFQMILVDTPGLHKPHDMLGEELNASALKALDDVDVVVMMIDSSCPVGKGDIWVARAISNTNAKKICVLSKTDLVTKEQVATQWEAAKNLCDFDAVVALSSVSGYNLDAFIEEASDLLPYGPKWFPDDMKTDQPIEVMVAEFIREKILRSFREEVPHCVGVQTTEMEYDDRKNLYRIFATIFVERESQKAMIIGKQGKSIKSIGVRAREDLEKLLGCRVYLELKAAVKKNWRSDEAQIRKFGYID